MPEKTVNLIDDIGVARSVPESEVEYRIDRQGWRLQTPEDVAKATTEAAKEEMYGGVGGGVAALSGGILRGATLGLSDVAVRVAGGEDARRYTEGLREHRPVLSTIGEIGGGSVAGGGIASRIGTRVASGLEGAGTIRQLAQAGVKYGTEGAIQGLGSGVSQLALSDDPLTLERIASTLGSNTLYGGAIGGGLGVVGKGIEKGLQRARVALDEYASKGLTGGADISDDLASLDRKGLRVAEKAELEAIEAARVPQRAQLADELKAFRQELKQNKLFLATKDAEEAEIRELAARSAKADKQLRNLIDNPKRLAKKPELAEAALQQQESALEGIVQKSDHLRAKFAGDATGQRVAALDYAQTALERNRGLQAKITALSGKPTSARLEAIAHAADSLNAPKATASLGDMVGQAGMSHLLGAAAGVPVLGQVVGAAQLVNGVVKKLGANSTELAKRGSQAIDAFLNVTGKVAPAAPVVATKVLASVAYGPPKKQERGTKPVKQKQPRLADSYRDRTDEIRSQIAPQPDGSLRMRPDARAKIAERLRPLQAADPLLADRLETAAARRIEYLASKIPRRPDAFASQTGPDTWQPSDMQMREFARHVAAVEDPHAIVERLASGQVTPEDVEAMKAVYPELHADITQQVTIKLGELRARLPYQRRLALSIFTGVPVDPAMSPEVLSVLQSTFTNEEGTESGTMAPRAQPAFGSISKPEPTPAQQRGA